jgi:hypothetical protein
MSSDNAAAASGGAAAPGSTTPTPTSPRAVPVPKKELKPSQKIKAAAIISKKLVRES